MSGWSARGKVWRKMWVWMCGECGLRWDEEVLVDGMDRPAMTCPGCGSRCCDGKSVDGGRWVVPGCMSVEDV